jgi:histidine triad (HIT) family protein
VPRAANLVVGLAPPVESTNDVTYSRSRDARELDGDARMSCTFCRIVAGDLPRTLLDEGERCLVILLVIPRVHAMLWHELDAVVAAEMAAMAHGWSRALVEALRPDGYNVLINNGAAAGQDVWHVHLHITPRSAGDGYYEFGGGHRVLSDDDAAALGAELARHGPRR